MAHENGGQAFPMEHTKGCLHCQVGMSLRDYFACHILESMVRPTIPLTLADAQAAYAAADLMIQARKNNV